MRNTHVILSKGIKLDKTYKQVLSYTETNMINLLRSSNYLVSEDVNYSFIRENGIIQTSLKYQTCLQANYLAFQNTDYSNKWFFAFIDKVEYKGENVTWIYYTVDEFTTWFDYWNPKSTFIIRQHATVDEVGLNTVPESIEHGEYVINGYSNVVREILFQNYGYMVISTALIEQATPEHNYINMGGAIVNGFAYICADADDVDYIIKAIDRVADAKVLYVYVVPLSIIPTSAISTELGLLQSWEVAFQKDKIIMPKPTTLDEYTPINKKLLQYPYQYLLFQNGAGSSNLLMYEKFSTDNVTMRYYGVPTIGCSIFGVPLNYNGVFRDDSNGLILGKFPVLGWSEDAYINWLTENGVNNTLKWGATGASIIGGIGMIAGGAALVSTGNPLGVGLISSGASSIIAGGSSAIEGAKEYYDHSIEPDSYKGNTNGGDIFASIHNTTFTYEPRSIKREWAEKIDKYFTRFGYAVNGIAYPNMLHRQNYNYIQISSDSNIGYPNLHNGLSVPATSMDLINKIYRAGVTIWNNHDNFGDYSVSNKITS